MVVPTVSLPKLSFLSEMGREKLRDRISELRADEARNYRRSRYWLTGLAIKTKAVRLREYISKINEADLDFLRHDPNIEEAVEEIRKLADELLAVADALNLDPEELRLLEQARERFEEGAA